MSLPILILGGADRHPGRVPAGMREADMLRGHKGALRLADGQALAAALVARLRGSGCFDDPVLVGPARVYQAIGLDCEIVDCEGNLAAGLRAGLQALKPRVRGDDPVAIIACDVLPGADEVAHLLATSYAPVSECVFWWELVEAQPEEMGASGWKPGYRLLAPARTERVHVYPGHLVILRPAGLRLHVTIDLIQLAYRYRNRPLAWRMPGMLARGMSALAWRDLCNLAAMHPSALSVSIPWYCVTGYARYRRGLLSTADLERAVANVFLRRAYRGAADGRPVVLAHCSTLALAKDLDTRAELDAALA